MLTDRGFLRTVGMVVVSRRFYHGHVESVEDMYSGLIGPLIIYEKGTLDNHGLPTVSFSSGQQYIY